MPPSLGEHPTALISWAHRDPGWDDAAVAARQDDVLRLSATLRAAGIDAELDLHHLSDGVDWTRWGPARAAASDFVLVVVSQQWRTAWEGGGDPTKGAGSAAEADVLRTLQSTDRDRFLQKVRLVQLPGSTDDDIPDGMHGLPRFRLATVDAAGAEDLIRSLTAQAKYPKAPLGPLPVLPPSGSSATDPETERRRLQAALDALPVPTPQDPTDLPWYRERLQTEAMLTGLGTLTIGGPAPSAETDALLTGQGTLTVGAPAPSDGLRYSRLPAPVEVQWKTDFAPTQSSQGLLTVHVLPVPPQPLPARQLAAVASELPARVRRPGLLDPVAALDVTDNVEGVAVALTPDHRYDRGVRLPALQGARVGVTGQVSAWTTLPMDGMGCLIDRDSLTAAISDCLRLAVAAGVPRNTDLALAAELGPVLMINVGPTAALGRSGATMNALGGPEHLRIEPDETVDSSALGTNRVVAAATLADVLLRTWRLHFPY